MEMDLPQKHYFWGHKYIRTPSRGRLKEFISIWIKAALEYQPNQAIVFFEQSYNKIEGINSLGYSDILIACATYANISILNNPYDETGSRYLISIDKTEKDKLTFITLSYGTNESKVALNVAPDSMSVALIAPTEEVTSDFMLELCSRMEYITKLIYELKPVWEGLPNDWEGDVIEVVSGSFNPPPKENFPDLLGYYLQYQSDSRLRKVLRLM